jgi:hypothetical protein
LALFGALAAVQSGPASNPEAQRILQASDSRFSPVAGRNFDYGELQPRGHYTATPDAQRYFRAFQYLTSAPDPKWSMEELLQLPAAVKSAALRWIASYQDLIAPSRSPLLWQDAPFQPPTYVRHLQTAPVGGHTIGVVALSAVVGRDGTRVEIPSTELRQKPRLARNFSELVVVFIHWGSELLDWPSVEQRPRPNG